MRKINGVVVTPLTVHHDDRGYLMEIIRATDPEFTKFGQVYLVGDLTAGTVRAFHKHDFLWDWFCISHGAAKFVLVDDRPGSPTKDNYMEIVIGDRRPCVITVPPGVYHGWMALQDDTQLVSVGSEVYNRDKPDEYRIPPDTYKDYYKDFWTIEAK